MSFWRRFRREEEELPPPVVRKPRESREESGRPAPPPATEAPPAGESVLGPGLRWLGTLKGKGRVRIEGYLEGNIQVQGEVVVGLSGRVLVDQVEALTVVVAGVLRGTVKARKVVLKRTGRLHGDVLTTALEAEEGGFLKGQVVMEKEVSFSWEEETSPPEAEASSLPDWDAPSDAENASETVAPPAIPDGKAS